MNDTQATPPRWAQALLASLVRTADAEAIPGDLLEEYRDSVRPRLGVIRADVWYVRHVLSVLWILLWPCLIAIAAVRLSTFFPSVWNPELVGAPGMSVLDAVAFAWAGYYGSRRTGLLRTGMITAVATSFVGFITVFAAALVATPNLFLAPFEKPFIFVILAIMLALTLTFSLVTGAVGAVLGRSWSSTQRKARAF